jgi:hypothetical protein
MRRPHGLTYFIAALAAIAAFAAFTPGAVAATKTVCPDGGVSNTTINGGLEVTDGNYCILANDTINGGITIDYGGDIELDNSTVNNGITVNPRGEIEVNPGSIFGGTFTTSTINGGITLNQPDDWDIETAHISGGVTFNGILPPFPPFTNSQPTFCGNTVIGSVSMRDVSEDFMSFPTTGDPTDEFGCPGNTISGSLSISNSPGEVEGNSVGGSVFLSGSTLEVNGNTIGGSLFCSNGTVILPGEDPADPTSNTVRGANTC